MGAKRCRGVAEVYSPPRLNLIAQKMGLQQGVSLDLRTVDEQGQRWDFDCPKRRKDALAFLRQEKPALLIGSPDCTSFSVIQRLNQANAKDPEIRE